MRHLSRSQVLTLNSLTENEIRVIIMRALKDRLKGLGALNVELDSDALITITNLDLSSDLKNATVRVSIYPETKESAVLPTLGKKSRLLHEFIVSKTKMKIIPKFKFEVDKGEKNRQKIDKLLYDIKE